MKGSSSPPGDTVRLRGLDHPNSIFLLSLYIVLCVSASPRLYVSEAHVPTPLYSRARHASRPRASHRAGVDIGGVGLDCWGDAG